MFVVFNRFFGRRITHSLSSCTLVNHFSGLDHVCGKQTVCRHFLGQFIREVRQTSGNCLAGFKGRANPQGMTVYPLVNEHFLGKTEVSNHPPVVGMICQRG